MNKIIQKEKIEFDLIHAHFIYPSGYVGAKLKERYDKPLIITGHGHDVYDLPFRDAEWNAKIKGILNKADHIITVSKSNYYILTRTFSVTNIKCNQVFLSTINGEEGDYVDKSK